jgi:hypothetical protein
VVGAWKSPKPRRGGVIARDGRYIRGRGRDKRAHRDTSTEPRCESGGLRHNGKHGIYSHAETSGARRGAFIRFSRPTLRRFSHLFVGDQFWRTAGAFSKTTIFFKLQAGVSLVSSSAPPPRCTTPTSTPRPRPRRTEFDHLKSL